MSEPSFNAQVRTPLGVTPAPGRDKSPGRFDGLSFRTWIGPAGRHAASKSASSPARRAFGEGGQPRMVRSTGTTCDTAPTVA